MTLTDEIANAHQQFSKIFVGGVPCLLNDDGAYLSFISIFAGTEALAGYRYPDESQNGKRFKDFVSAYFEPRYQAHLAELWDLRNSMIHGFSPQHFALCHHQSHLHFTDLPGFIKVLNAEDVYAAFVAAAERYFLALQADPALQTLFEKRLKHSKGGSLYVVSSGA